jgi:hypothetical protein
MTHEIAPMLPSLPAMTPEQVASVRSLESALRNMAQVDLLMEHLFHAGMYARTIAVPAGVLLTGALLKRATTLVISGDVTVYVGDDCERLTGHHVLPGSAGRKQAFVSHALTHLTMLFPTQAKSVAEAEAEFTDETALLEHGTQRVVITGE